MLNNYNKEPRDENWLNIEATLREDITDMHIKTKFDNFEVTPPASNWTSIESSLKQPISTRSKVNYGLRIAASICLILFAFSYTRNNTAPTFSEVHKGLVVTDAINYDLCHTPELITLEIVKIKPVRKKRKKKSRKAIATTKQKRLLDIILEIDEEIVASVDSTLIADLMQPADILTGDNMYATTGRFNQFTRNGSKYRKLYYLPEIKYNLKIPNHSIDSIFNKKQRP